MMRSAYCNQRAQDDDAGNMAARAAKMHRENKYPTFHDTRSHMVTRRHDELQTASIYVRHVRSSTRIGTLKADIEDVSSRGSSETT